jgi:hypothetical protein
MYNFTYMDLCVCIQCFCKPIETLITLKSLEQCKEIQQLNLLLFIDNAQKNSKFEQKNNELIHLLEKYKLENQALYKSITIIIADHNLGPYIACASCIDNAFKMNSYILFSEDDSIFCKDSIYYCNQYINGIIPNDINCLGITTQSNHFYSNNVDIFDNVNGIIKTKTIYEEKIKTIKQDVILKEYSNKVEKVRWAPNKQFCMCKLNWEKIKYFRTINYCNSKSNTIAPDEATGIFVNNNNYYFYYSIIPRTNDIGLFNELGCTTLYYTGIVPMSTIKYITSNDFVDIEQNNYEVIDNITINTII